ncbi:MAG: 4-hydroxy-3-methylbut-2-enyl diphosphate reductase [Bacteroidia bacterium]|nr:4-hydroxy-3-methylbut-2-enyl diphosphate reductase [Bacteroidia bacterium]
MKKFDVPSFYRSPVISRMKALQAMQDPRRESLEPMLLDLGPVRFFIPRHFGFCYGVENAIEIAFRALSENPGKRIFLVSQMIHNPAVNRDLEERGVRFLMDTAGKVIIPPEEISPEDVVIIPAFGASVKVVTMLQQRGLELKKYDTTCPFVEKVWNRSARLGEEKYSVIIHGKAEHEETRATFSRSSLHSPSLVVLNREEALILTGYIEGKVNAEEILEVFKGKYSPGFDPVKHLQNVGVVNQTTMLASETEEIAGLFRNAMMRRYGKENLKMHFADTRDTLCYATNQNQDATIRLAEKGGFCAFVVGGYNSSNTTHLVEILEKKMPVYFIQSAASVQKNGEIMHFNIHRRQEESSVLSFPAKDQTDILITSGASCPDSMVDEVIRQLAALFPGALTPEEGLGKLGLS